MNEIKDLFILLQKRDAKILKDNAIILAEDEQQLIITILVNIYENRYNEGFVACARKQQAILPSPNN